MRHSLTILFALLISTLLVKQVRAPLPHAVDTEPEPEPEPEPVPNQGEESGSDSTSGSDDDSGTVGIGSPAAPVSPPAEGNEAEFEEEDTDYSEILEHVKDLLDAITEIISDLADGSSTTVSAPLPTAALPCYHASSIYNGCGLHNSVFPNVVFPIQASCLCYVTEGSNTTAIWAPSSYDGLLSSCNKFAQTQTLASITKVGNSTSDFNLCASAGDVRATPALAAASSTTTISATPAPGSTTTPAASTPTATGTSGSANRVSALRLLIASIGLWLCRIAI